MSDEISKSSEFAKLYAGHQGRLFAQAEEAPH